MVGDLGLPRRREPRHVRDVRLGQACRRAQRRRIPERSLLTAALLGGSPAAFVAGRMMRHKTVKRSFRVRFALVVVIQLALVALVLCSMYRNP
jgi:uncharacterized membrane protein YsdA (DUF1294 family)